MLADFWGKVKNLYAAYRSDFYIAAIIFLVGLGGFGLGRLSAIWPEKMPIVVEEPAAVPPAARQTAARQLNTTEAAIASGAYVASKNGAAYHFPWCPGAQRIKEENKILFETKEAAEAAGYRPAGNCEGL